MKKFFALSAAALAIFATACNKELAPETEISGNKVKMTLTVNAPAETRTALEKGVNVVWQEGDAITVFGSETSNSNGYKFTIKSGVGSATATFEGEIAEDDISEVFYAVYPAVAVRPASLKSGKIELDKSLGEVQTAVKDGYDPDYAVLAGIVSADNKVTFLHGMAYFKLTVGTEGVYSINLKTSNTRFGGRPVYEVSSDEGFGIKPSIESAEDNITLKPASGTFEKGATYYIPVPVKDSKLRKLTVSYAFDEEGTAVESISTDAKSNENLELGKVYDLGTPPITFAPKINVTAPAALAADATSGSFAYSLVRPDGESSVTANVTSGNDWLSNVVVGEEIVSFDCTANDAEEAREAVIVLSYPGAEDVEVTITQKAVAGSDPIHYTWDFGSAEWQAEFAKYGSVNTDIENWNLTYDGLTLYSKAKSKYNPTYFQWGGKGSTSDRYARFEAPAAGTLTVTTSHTSNSEDMTRMVTVNQGGVEDSQPGGAASGSPAALEFEVEAGEVLIYCTGNALRFYKIEFVSEGGSTGGNDGGDDPGTEPGENEGEVANTYTLYVDSSKKIVKTGEYFTTVTESIADFSTASDVNYNGPFTIDGTEYKYGLKMDSKGEVKFTTSKSYNTTVQFYFACRKSADASDSRMKITPTGGEAITFPCPFEKYGDSGVLTLEKDTEYTIAQDKRENGLILVIVKETE